MNPTLRRTVVFLLLSASFLGALVSPSLVAQAAVSRVEIIDRTPVADGRVFETTGAWERLRGRVWFRLDPQLPANAAVVDLGRAARDERGLVEFSADLELLAPVDRSRSNGTLFYDVNNRGRRMCVRMFDGDADHFLLRQGFVVVWSGWLAEVLPVPEDAGSPDKLLQLQAPIARGENGPLTGLVRYEIVTDKPANTLSIADRPMIGAYRPTDAGFRQATLTQRASETAERTAVPRDEWELLVREMPGATLPRIDLKLNGGFVPGRLYELIYEARDPVVQGVGLTGIRDLVSFLKYETGPGNPLAVTADVQGRSTIRQAIGFGISQSGRCLRTLTYLGFNADERGRRVFDGLIPHVAGGGLGFFNHRFAMPTRFSGQHGDHAYPCDMFPFAYERQHDPRTGRDDGILESARKANVVPKIFHIQNSAEYWHRSGSLVHTDPESRTDAKLPSEVRVYAVGGAQHGWGDDVASATGDGQLPDNPTDYRPLLRGLLVALDAWIRDGREPPPSRHPRIADKTLVDWSAEATEWPALPGVRYPRVIQQPERFDFGSAFDQGLLTEHPPRRLGTYRVLVPAYDGDGNERGMLQPPFVGVPLATFTGWNLRKAKIGAENELLRLKGSYLDFPRTREERAKSGDPRRALDERYADFDAYRAAVGKYVRQLVQERFLVAEDENLYEERTLAKRAAWTGK